jgi:hypothetical protein
LLVFERGQAIEVFLTPVFGFGSSLHDTSTKQGPHGIGRMMRATQVPECGALHVFAVRSCRLPAPRHVISHYRRRIQVRSDGHRVGKLTAHQHVTEGRAHS